jgi:hypothetical protein
MATVAERDNVIDFGGFRNQPAFNAGFAKEVRPGQPALP